MTRRSTANTVQWGIEIDEDLANEVMQFAGSRKQTKRQVIEEALRRHLAYPPPILRPHPFPDVGQPPVTQEQPDTVKPTRNRGTKGK